MSRSASRLRSKKSATKSATTPQITEFIEVMGRLKQRDPDAYAQVLAEGRQLADGNEAARRERLIDDSIINVVDAFTQLHAIAPYTLAALVDDIRCNPASSIWTEDAQGFRPSDDATSIIAAVRAHAADLAERAVKDGAESTLRAAVES